MYANLQELLSYRKPTALFKIKLFLSEISLVYFLPLVELLKNFSLMTSEIFQ